MKAIITRANSDGTWDEVGMNNRFIMTSRSESNMRKKAREYANPRDVRIQYLDPTNIYASYVKELVIKSI